MKRLVFVATAVAAAMVIVAPVAGGGTWSSGELSSVAASPVAFITPLKTVSTASSTTPSTESSTASTTAPAAKSAGAISAGSSTGAQTQGPIADDGHVTTKPVVKKAVTKHVSTKAAARRITPPTTACPGAIGGSAGTAPGVTSKGGVLGTTTADLQSFAASMNAIRVAHCLAPIPLSHFRYDSCMEQRLFWMAEDPSTNPMSAWGHIGSRRSDGVPSVGCDGNIAGGSGNTGAVVAQKWWDSTAHRSVEYRPTYKGSTGGVCILFAMTHGGIPNEPTSFTRAASRWTSC